ncbi:MAG: glycosyltransferase, partial [Gammaproteobacteria bacterium]|nr:glycosyltransferase [Gammaproteobacteria bacterium]
MTTLLIIITLVALFIPVYVYIGYPVLLIVLDKLIKGKTLQTADITPTVSLIVSCYNEVDVIEQKIVNCLAIDYPQQQLEIIFVSDGSDDGSDEII